MANRRRCYRGGENYYQFRTFYREPLTNNALYSVGEKGGSTCCGLFRKSAEDGMDLVFTSMVLRPAPYPRDVPDMIPADVQAGRVGFS
jgi:hypothetical protein